MFAWEVYFSYCTTIHYRRVLKRMSLNLLSSGKSWAISLLLKQLPLPTKAGSNPIVTTEIWSELTWCHIPHPTCTSRPPSFFLSEHSPIKTWHLALMVVINKQMYVATAPIVRCKDWFNFWTRVRQRQSLRGYQTSSSLSQGLIYKGTIGRIEIISSTTITNHVG